MIYNVFFTAKRKRSPSPDFLDSEKWQHAPLLAARTKQNISKIFNDKYKKPDFIKDQPNVCEDIENIEKTSEQNVNTNTPEPECIDCALYNLDEKDTRCEYFAQLLKEELKYVNPCLQTRIYAKILLFLNSLKHNHSRDITLSETEKNV